MALVLAVELSGVGCESPEPSNQSAAKPTQNTPMTPPFGNPDDLKRAASLWQTMDGYTGWDPFPGFEGWQPGFNFHGRDVKYFINHTTAENLVTFLNGSIIVKEVYRDRAPEAMMAVTAMQKIPGYDPEHNDWFWVKFAPDGSVMSNPLGMKLAGRVGKGMMKGCIPCHSSAGGEDFVFANDFLPKKGGS